MIWRDVVDNSRLVVDGSVSPGGGVWTSLSHVIYLPSSWFISRLASIRHKQDSAGESALSDVMARVGQHGTPGSAGRTGADAEGTSHHFNDGHATNRCRYMPSMQVFTVPEPEHEVPGQSRMRP